MKLEELNAPTSDGYCISDGRTGAELKLERVTAKWDQVKVLQLLKLFTVIACMT